MNRKSESLIVVDGYGFVFRSWHVQPALLSPDGMPVSAIYGFTSMIIKLVADFNPGRIVIVLDSGQKNFRHEIYPAYKANRPPAPEDLKLQFPVIREVASSMNIQVMEKEGLEADDIISTICFRARAAQEEVIIVSSDKDLMQLMSDTTRIYDPVKRKYIEQEDVQGKFGVDSSQIIDALALIGDSSDNIPGAAGIGPKTAAKLLSEFKNIDDLYDSLENIPNEKLRQKLASSRDNVFLSKSLIKLSDHDSLEINFDDFTYNLPDPDQLSVFLNKYGFNSLHKRAGALLGGDMVQKSDNTTPTSFQVKPIELLDDSLLDDILQKIEYLGVVSIKIINIAKQKTLLFAPSASEVYFFKLDLPKNQLEFEQGTNIAKNSKSKKFIEFLTNMLASTYINKIIYSLKDLDGFLKDLGHKNYKLANCDDLHLTNYLLNAGKKNAIDEIDTDNIEYQAKELLLHPQMLAKDLRQLQTENILHLYRDIDLPLALLLQKIELSGIKINVELLQNLSKEFLQKIKELEEKIFQHATIEFNIGSPKQLGEILFDKMGLPSGKKLKKSKTYSTGIEVLESLSNSGYEIADLILEWRHFTKLKNTYTDVLTTQAGKLDHRVHTIFLQTSTTTGRLSSHSPNLQNIPIRTSQGHNIRRSFIAQDGYKIVSADYSQIELRILAHISGDEQLRDAFKENKDIHSATAKFIFGDTADAELAGEHRRKAKAINFGIIYGISAFGLAKQLGISKSDASKYIEQYFTRHKLVDKYMKDTVEFASKHGYVANILGRRCYVPSISSGNFVLRNFAERAAINAPIQSTSADMIKIAMINLDRWMRKQGLLSRIILQIHDELLIEAHASEVDQILPKIKNIMQNALLLDVPVIVDTKIGDNWMDMEKC